MSAADDFRLYRASDAVLIRVGGGEIELTAEAAERLARELLPAEPPEVPYRRMKWTDEKIAELRRLYVDEGLPPREVAKRFGTSTRLISWAIRNHRLPSQNKRKSQIMRAVWAARKADQ